MPKLKVHSGARKRFKVTGSGLKRKKSNKSHILTKMSTNRKRQLRGTTSVSSRSGTPNQLISQESANSSAILIAGKMCPPVPLAAIKRRGIK